LIGTGGFLLTALLMLNGSLERLDLAVQSAVLALRSPALTAFMVPLSYSGNWQAVTPLCLLLLLIPRVRRPYGVPLTLAALSAVLFYQALKHLFMRMRPDVSLHLLEQHGYSFPSGHSLTSFLVWGMMALLLLYYYRSCGVRLPFYKKETGPVPYIRSEKRLKPVIGLLMLYIVLMGFSRIYVGVHWPSDVLGSWFLSLPILAALKRIIWR
jgi:undecaprenyl-diphosphatase